MAFHSVAAAFTAAEVALDRARRDLRQLDALTFVLPDACTSRYSYAEVSHAYANWLVWVRMIGVAITAAGQRAGNPPAFADWWTGVADDEVHAFFRAARNAALKEVADLIVNSPLRLSIDDTRAFFAFDRGPFRSDPLVPRCQQYTEWLYDECLAPARERLWDRRSGRFVDGSDPSPREGYWPARDLV